MNSLSRGRGRRVGLLIRGVVGWNGCGFCFRFYRFMSLFETRGRLTFGIE